MPKYTLNYGRTISIKTTIEAENEDEAWDKAWKLENEGKLGTEHVEFKEGSWLDDIFDAEFIWELEEDYP